MDMKDIGVNLFFISMLVDREKKWDSYKMEVVIRKGGRWLLWNLIGKGSSYEVIRLENEVIIFNCLLEWSKDNHMTIMVM
jgi:hypothetical protein